jgi:MoaA/NifB/PqqE/SkfB family radical SAM enzyme
MQNKKLKKRTFNKIFENSDYQLAFDTETGFEILRGVNKEDPFSLILPSLLDIGIMGHCENECVFCYQGYEAKPNMRFEDFISILDQIKHHTNQIALGGRGDPNKHENFKEIVEYCRNNNVVPNYTTSGNNITKNEIEISKLCGAVAVSDYSLPYTYKAVKKLIKGRVRTSIQKIYTKYSYKECELILKGENPWGKKINIEKLYSIVFLLFKPVGAGSKLLNFIPEEYQIKNFTELFFNHQSHPLIGTDSCTINHCLKYSYHSEKQLDTIDTCEAARMSAYISSDMIMMPCSFADEKKFGVSLRNNTIKNIWENSYPFKYFKNALLKNPDKCPLGY